MAPLELRLRVTSPELLALPWRDPISQWDPTAVEFRDIPVGPSRHLVRFVEADGALWALKALPRRVALREYQVLRSLEGRRLAAVRAAGVVLQPTDDDAVLVTHYLQRSWQYRRLLMRIPVSQSVQRGRLFDAMALLLVDLHRNGVYWGDCSLANTLFTRDGQILQAWLVDAETAETHAALTDGQREGDIEIMVENVAGGLLDVAARRGEPATGAVSVYDEALSVGERYRLLWELLHDEPVVPLADTLAMERRVRELQDLGFAVDEVRLESADGTEDCVRLKVAVAGRSYHSELLASLTGLDVGEGQATILVNDLRAHRNRLVEELGREVPERQAARQWLDEVFEPGVERAHGVLGGAGDPTQAYCDLLEVRWLLSEQAGHDVGDGPALEALARRATPDTSAASLSFVELPTQELPPVPPEGGPR